MLIKYVIGGKNQDNKPLGNPTRLLHLRELSHRAQIIEDSTTFNRLSDAYTAFTNLSIIEVRRMRVLTALQGDWTITRISDGQTWQGTFTGDQFTIGPQTATVTVETSRSILITGLSIGNLFVDAININTLKSRDESYLLTRNL